MRNNQKITLKKLSQDNHIPKEILLYYLKVWREYGIIKNAVRNMYLRNIPLLLS